MTDNTDSYNVTAEADQAHDDKWLADAVVALEIGECVESGGPFGYRFNDQCTWCHDAVFVRDWRVVGALMERMITGELTIWRQAYDDDSPVWIVETHLTNADGRNESLPRAIIEACVEAQK